MRTTIGVVHGPDDAPGPGSADARDGTESRVMDSISAAGAEPVPLESLESLEACAPGAVVVCGGAFDIPPEWYGQRAVARVDRPRLERSRLERAVLREAERRRLPVLGICNGAQLMAVTRGGSLVQDLSTQWPRALQHEQGESGDRAVHPVDLTPDSRLASLLGETRFDVNSTHHQGIDSPGRGVQIVGRAPDGVVEAIEDPALEFWIGVQWHPERLRCAHGPRLFEALVRAARTRDGH